ncbi:hypothetical protein ACFT2C_05060 [Promicromonospora sp. NPDC057138]|uniref:hypothetical protein n=1 Tax=Promicromonospora sp. NPDC057138 TaxID=3346031 RepID=UPI00363F63D0
MDENRTNTPDDTQHNAPTHDPAQPALADESMLDDFVNNAFMLPSDVEALDEDFDSPDESTDNSGDDDPPDDEDPFALPAGFGATSGYRPGRPAVPSLPLRPMNLNLLSSFEASLYWRDLDTWVTWMRRDYGLGVTVIPPLWHRHAELRWELSALHTAWLAAYDPKASASAPITWHRELVEAKDRLLHWVSVCGTGLNDDRPTPITLWPGETGFGSQETWDSDAVRPRTFTDRAADFEAWVAQDIAARRAVEDRVRSEVRRPVPGTMPRLRTDSGRS